MLDFRSSNDRHKPVVEALALIERHKDSSTTYLPLGETAPLEGVVRKDCMERASSGPCATGCAAPLAARELPFQHAELDREVVADRLTQRVQGQDL